MSADPRGPSGTGHEDGFERESIPEWVAGMACQSSYPHEAHGSCPGLRRPAVPPVAVPGPASEPICPGPHGNGCDCKHNGSDPHCPWVPGPASVSPAARVRVPEGAARPSAPGEGPPADPVVSPADTIRDKAQQIIDKPQSPFGGSESGEEAWYWTHDWLAGFAQDVLALLAVGERDRAERERQQKRAERAEQVLREQVAANRTLVVAGERDRQQIAQLTEIVNAAESGARIPPVDCTNHCSDGPCDCSGEWRTVAWRIDVPALRAVLADEEDAGDE